MNELEQYEDMADIRFYEKNELKILKQLEDRLVQNLIKPKNRYKNILEFLKEKRIFTVNLIGQKLIYFEEACDECFSVSLTKGLMKILIDELTVLHNEME